MSRLTKIEGTFMGVKFEVKPTPINFKEIEEQRRQMLLGWYEEHCPETHKKLIDEDLELSDYTNEDVLNMEKWLQDVEFRSKYLRFMAEKCMDFSGKVDDSVWESDDLEYGTIEEAWDFFMKRQRAR